jgi:hypothetical protein
MFWEPSLNHIPIRYSLLFSVKFVLASTDMEMHVDVRITEEISVDHELFPRNILKSKKDLIIFCIL